MGHVIEFQFCLIIVGTFRIKNVYVNVITIMGQSEQKIVL